MDHERYEMGNFKFVESVRRNGNRRIIICRRQIRQIDNLSNLTSRDGTAREEEEEGEATNGTKVMEIFRSITTTRNIFRLEPRTGARKRLEMVESSLVVYRGRMNHVKVGVRVWRGIDKQISTSLA